MTADSQTLNAATMSQEDIDAIEARLSFFRERAAHFKALKRTFRGITPRRQAYLLSRGSRDLS
jgi:hypothetical protein